MSKNSENVKKWRRATKRRMIEAMGGKCVCCEYKECDEAMDFHHLDPILKKYNFARIITNPAPWAIIVEELRKCVLLCCRCHREVEAGRRQLPDVFARFDEAYATKVEFRLPRIRYCRQCGKELNTFDKNRRLCSDECRKLRMSFYRRKTEWPTSEQLRKLLQEESYCSVARKFGVSDNAVRKWAKYYGII